MQKLYVGNSRDAIHVARSFISRPGAGLVCEMEDGSWRFTTGQEVTENDVAFLPEIHRKRAIKWIHRQTKTDAAEVRKDAALLQKSDEQLAKIAGLDEPVERDKMIAIIQSRLS